MFYPFNYQNIHKCEATILMCIDFRFHEQTLNFLRQELRVKDFDIISLPGASKNLVAPPANGIFNEVLGYLRTSIKLHDPKKIILINHADCGAYGGRAVFASLADERLVQLTDLKKAREILGIRYPFKQVILVYANLALETSEIKFEIIE